MKRILAITGTRADWSKLLPLIHSVWDDHAVYCAIVGQHLDPAYGSTHLEVERQFADAPWRTMRMLTGVGSQPHTVTLERTVMFLTNAAQFFRPDLVVVHGDRTEALAAASLSLDGYRVAHVEGGEISGSVDERIRHACTKLADDHFVSGNDAARRLYEMGEDPGRVHVIGSPEIDTLRSATLPSMDAVRQRYDLPDRRLALMCLHPELRLMGPVLERIRGAMVAAALRHNLCWVVFEPNSDPGHQEIRDAWHGQPWPRVPSMRAEHFARLLRKAHLVCGNSSAVVREAPAVGTPAVSLGDRQQGRSDAKMLISLGVPRTERQLLDAIAKALTKERVPCDDFGDGHSSERFRRIVTAPEFWERRTEKQWMYVV